MELIGHRGCPVQSAYPENTVRAAEEAANHLPAIEIDVRRCGSGHIIVHHDEVIEQSDRKLRLAETDYETLQEIELGPLGDTIPLLTDIIRNIPKSVTLQVELKETGTAEDVFEIVEEAPIHTRVSSFSVTALEEFNDTESDIPTGYLFHDKYKKNLDVALDIGCDNVHPHHKLCTETDVVRRAKEQGLRVIAWNTDNSSVVAAMNEANVDGITVDRWDLTNSTD